MLDKNLDARLVKNKTKRGNFQELSIFTLFRIFPQWYNVNLIWYANKMVKKLK